MNFDEAIHKAIHSVREEADKNLALVELLDEELRASDNNLSQRLVELVFQHQTRRKDAITQLIGLVQTNYLPNHQQHRPALQQEIYDKEADLLNIYGRRSDDTKN